MLSTRKRILKKRLQVKIRREVGDSEGERNSGRTEDLNWKRQCY